jgi:uncharacterized protein
MNPFLITGYLSRDYFCDRIEETEKLLGAVSNGRHITLFSLRRMGKSSLITHLFHRLQKQKDFICIQFDILPTSGMHDFVSNFGKAVALSIPAGKSGFMNTFRTFVSSIGASLSFDPVSGNPSLDFNFKDQKQTEKSLEEIFNFLENNGKRIVVAIDEFQQITRYPEKNTEAVLRTLIQKTRNISFIFSGSHQGMLTSIFSDYSRPFYQSTQFMKLERISEKEYSDFIFRHFKAGRKKITEGELKTILTFCRCHTFYVQAICNRAYGENEKLRKDGIQAILNMVLQENESIYINYRNLLTGIQWNLLKAIAKENGLAEPHAYKFLRKHHLSGPSTIKRALDSLLQKEMIYQEEGKFWVYDIFLSRWLEKH